VVRIVVAFESMVPSAMLLTKIALNLPTFVVVFLIDLAVLFLIARISSISTVFPLKFLFSLPFLPIQPPHRFVGLVVEAVMLLFVPAFKGTMLLPV
jgi:hypothetical protein